MPTWTSDGKPDWLSNNNNKNEEKSENNKHRVDVEEQAPQKERSSSVNITISNSVKSKNSTNTDDDDSDADRKPQTRCGQVCNVFCVLLSVMFIGIFVTATLLFQYDSTLMDMQWFFFFIYQGIAAFLALISRHCGFCECIISFVSWGGLIWSIVLIVFMFLDYNKMDSGGPTYGGDYNNLTDKQEKTIELVEAAIGAANCLYHLTLFYFFC